ncbi:MAG: tetratricopeptide repeat protein, partial [Longimicrobiales bacterium]
VEESLAHYERAAQLDPLSPSIGFSLGWTYMALRRFDDAIAQKRNESWASSRRGKREPTSRRSASRSSPSASVISTTRSRCWSRRAKQAIPWLTGNGFDLIFDPLRSDPRWTRLRERMGIGT